MAAPTKRRVQIEYDGKTCSLAYYESPHTTPSVLRATICDLFGVENESTTLILRDSAGDALPLGQTLHLAGSTLHLEVKGGTPAGGGGGGGGEKAALQIAASEARVARFERVLEISRCISAEMGWAEAVDTIIRYAAEVVNSDRCTLFIVDHAAGELRVAVSEGRDDGDGVPVRPYSGRTPTAIKNEHELQTFHSEQQLRVPPLETGRFFRYVTFPRTFRELIVPAFYGRAQAWTARRRWAGRCRAARSSSPLSS